MKISLKQLAEESGLDLTTPGPTVNKLLQEEANTQAADESRASKPDAIFLGLSEPPIEVQSCAPNIVIPDPRNMIAGPQPLIWRNEANNNPQMWSNPTIRSQLPPADQGYYWNSPQHVPNFANTNQPITPNQRIGPPLLVSQGAYVYSVPYAPGEPVANEFATSTPMRPRSHQSTVSPHFGSTTNVLRRSQSWRPKSSPQQSASIPTSLERQWNPIPNSCAPQSQRTCQQYLPTYSTNTSISPRSILGPYSVSPPPCKVSRSSELSPILSNGPQPGFNPTIYDRNPNLSLGRPVYEANRTFPIGNNEPTSNANTSGETHHKSFSAVERSVNKNSGSLQRADLQRAEDTHSFICRSESCGCGRTFQTARGLARHNDFVFSCPNNCGKRFRNQFRMITFHRCKGPQGNKQSPINASNRTMLATNQNITATNLVAGKMIDPIPTPFGSSPPTLLDLHELVKSVNQTASNRPNPLPLSSQTSVPSHGTSNPSTAPSTSTGFAKSIHDDIEMLLNCTPASDSNQLNPTDVSTESETWLDAKKRSNFEKLEENLREEESIFDVSMTDTYAGSIDSRSDRPSTSLLDTTEGVLPPLKVETPDVSSANAFQFMFGAETIDGILQHNSHDSIIQDGRSVVAKKDDSELFPTISLHE